jgi:hypothetical protein
MNLITQLQFSGQMAIFKTYSTMNRMGHFKTVAIFLLLMTAKSIDGYVIPNVRNKPISNAVDTTNLGSLTVPVVGCGTISWSSNSCE